MKRSSYTCYKNNFFLDRRNKYFECFHRKLFYNSKNFSNKYSSIEIKNIDLRKHNTKKTDYIRIYSSRENPSRRKLDRSSAIEAKSVLDYLRKNAIDTKIYLHY